MSTACKTIRFTGDIALLGNNAGELQKALHQTHKILKDKCDTTEKQGKTKGMKLSRSGE